MMARDGARLLMLGTPNGGSWAPMQVLSGDDTFGNMLVAFGSLVRQITARAQTDGRNARLPAAAGGVARPDARPRQGGQLAAARRRGPRRRAARTGSLVAHRAAAARRLQMGRAAAGGARSRRSPCASGSTRSGDLGADAPKMLLVVGKAPTTPAGDPATRAASPIWPARATAASRSRARGCPASRRGRSTPRTAICQREGRLRRLSRAADPRRHDAARSACRTRTCPHPRRAAGGASPAWREPAVAPRAAPRLPPPSGRLRRRA